MIPTPMNNLLAALERLDEGAPKPSPAAREKANTLVVEIYRRHAASPLDVDRDPLGGVAIYYSVRSGTLWISIRNTLQMVAILMSDAEERAKSITDADDLIGFFACRAETP